MSHDSTDDRKNAWREVLTPEEIRDLHRISDLRAWASIAIDWGMIFGSFALVAYRPNLLTIILALFIIGARQLGFGIWSAAALLNCRRGRARL